MFIPFDYQLECLTAIETARLTGLKSALVVMASGLGKTVTVAFDVSYWLQSRGGRVLYLCHQNEILGQACRTFQDVLGENLTYGFYHGLEKSPYKVDCLFASLQTMSDNCQFFDPEDFDFIVVDEGHHISASSYEKVVAYFKPKFLLGVTATPDRMDGLDIRTVFGEEIYSLSLEEALARSLLTPVDYRLITDEIDSDYIDSLKENGKAKIKDLDEHLFVTRSDRDIASIVQTHAAELPTPRIIVFVETVARANQLIKSIPNSVAIHSEIHNKERVVNLELFRYGMIETVIAVDCLNEGVDIPEANLIVFLRSTASSTIFLQQLGRGLRKCNGKDRIIVLDLVASCDRICRVKELSDRIGIRHQECLREGLLLEEDEQSSRFRFAFDNRALSVLDVIKGLQKSPRIADIPELFGEYSTRNNRAASSIRSLRRGVVWWKCGKCGHEYQMSPAARQMGRGCERCESTVTASNNLEACQPEMAKEYSKKNKVPASQILALSRESVLWECSVCCYEWYGRPSSRITRKDSCPACSAQDIFCRNNFALQCPHLVTEYSYTNTVSPDKFDWRSSFKRWWICRHCGTSWQASSYRRADGQGGCPNACSPSVDKTN